MSFTFYTPAAHALLFQFIAGVVAYTALIGPAGEREGVETYVFNEDDPKPGAKEQENNAFSIALCTTSAFALSCYLKRDPYATVVPLAGPAIMAIANLINGNQIRKFEVVIGAVVLAGGTALAAVTAPLFNAL